MHEKRLHPPHGQREPTASAEQLTRRLCEIWADLLRVETVGAWDNFFALGGNSLLAVQFAARISDELGFDVPVRTLFQAPCVADFADLLGTDLGLSRARSDSDR